MTEEKIDLEEFGKDLEKLAATGNRFAVSLLIAWKAAKSEDAKRVIFEMVADVVKKMAAVAQKKIDEYDAFASGKATITEYASGFTKDRKLYRRSFKK